MYIYCMYKLLFMKLQHFRIDWKSELSSSTNVFQEVAIIVRVNNEAALVNLYPFLLLDSDHFLKQQKYFNYGRLGNINALQSQLNET